MSADRFYGGQSPSGKGSGITLNVLGHTELMELYKQLSRSQEKSIQISAFRKAAKPLITDAQSTLQSRTRSTKQGSLYKSLGTAPLRRLPILKIGARTGGNWAGYAGHLIDEGTEDRKYFHKKSGKEHKTGKIRGTKFWTDSVRSNEKGMVDSVQDQIIKSFDKLIVKYNNKAKT